MAIFCFRGPFDYYFKMENQEIGHIFANKPRNEKIKALYFLQLLKLEEIEEIEYGNDLIFKAKYLGF